MANSIIGDDDANVIHGTAGDDLVTALGDDDRIYASTGHDSVDGGEGYDTLTVELYDHAMFPVPTQGRSVVIGADLLSASLGLLDTAFTSIERVEIFASDYLNPYANSFDASAFTGVRGVSIQSGAGDDIVTGSAQDDNFSLGRGNNTVDGGLGQDELSLSFKGQDGAITSSRDGDVLVFTQNGVTNRISGVEAISIFEATLEAGLNIDASAATESLTFYNTDEADTLIGGAGDDQFVVQSFTTADRFTGGGGADRFAFITLYEGSGTATITDFEDVDRLSLSYGSSSYPLRFIGTDAFTHHEREYRYRVAGGVTFVEFDRDGNGVVDRTIQLTNGEFALVETEAGSNVLKIAPTPQYGDALANALGGTDQDDLIYGLGGADTLRGLDGHDRLDGGDGTDQLLGFAGNDTLAGGSGNDVLSGSYGNDTASYADAAGGVAVNLAITASQNTGGAGIDKLIAVENLIGSAFNDTLQAGAGDNRLEGGAGNDFLIGGAGNDTLLGGSGIDTASYIDAQAGLAMSLGRADAQSTGGGGIDQLIGIENLRGSRFNDLLYGDANANRIAGAEGDDQLFGLEGDDVLIGGDGRDKFDGGTGNDTLTGDDGNDVLAGGSANDAINGGSGNDLINGEAGRDTLTGGLGADRFVYTKVSDSPGGAGARDRITDFSRAQGDKINLSAMDARTGGANDAFAFIGATGFGHVAGQLRVTGSGSNWVVQGDVDGDAVADFTMDVVSATALVAADFLL